VKLNQRIALRAAGLDRKLSTFTEAEVHRLLSHADGDRLAHAWHLTPSRLRREATRIRPSYACSRWWRRAANALA